MSVSLKKKIEKNRMGITGYKSFVYTFKSSPQNMERDCYVIYIIT